MRRLRRCKSDPGVVRDADYICDLEQQSVITFRYDNAGLSFRVPAAIGSTVSTFLALQAPGNFRRWFVQGIVDFFLFVIASQSPTSPDVEMAVPDDESRLTRRRSSKKSISEAAVEMGARQGALVDALISQEFILLTLVNTLLLTTVRSYTLFTSDKILLVIRQPTSSSS